MQKNGMHIRNLRGHLKKLQNYPGKVEKANREAIRNTTLYFEGKAVREVPVDKGELRKRITHTINSRRGVVIAGTKYAQAVHEGTRPHTIRARNARGVLSFKVGGKRIYTRKPIRHPGTKANPFFTRVIEKHGRKMYTFFDRAFKRQMKK